jgi:hypothetical protein
MFHATANLRRDPGPAAPRRGLTEGAMLKRIKLWILIAAPLMVAPLIPGCPLIP